jgi:Ser/Thr protein kinase RdoA (MazF antagonist)
MSIQHSRIRSLWTDDPHDPARTTISNPDVRRLIERIAPGAEAIDIGGTMSLNARLVPDDLVLRVHQPFVTHDRLLFEQRLRSTIAGDDIVTSPALSFDGQTVFDCGPRLAEFERHIPHQEPRHSPETYEWLFRQMAVAHERLALYNSKVAPALAATWAPPGSLRRWSAVTEAAFSSTPAGRDAARRLHAIVNYVRRDWTRPTDLPCQVIHGDFRLGNVCSLEDGRTLILDFGFADVRPRSHDLAYTLAFMLLALGEDMWDIDRISTMVESYNSAASVPLGKQEVHSIPAYSVAVLLHALAHYGFTAKPLAQLPHRLPFLQFAEWITRHSGEYFAKVSSAWTCAGYESSRER